jgi:hypothetical protein
MNQSNNRNTPRLPRQSKDLWQIHINHDELITRHIMNMSPTGLSFKAPQRVHFEEGQKVQLFVQVSPTETFECEAKVVWQQDQQYGLRFSKIPQYFDAWIMKAINEFFLETKAATAGWAPSFDTSSFRGAQRGLERNNFLYSAMGLAMIAVMTVAFIASLFISQHRYPEYNISNIFQRALLQKAMNGPGK